MRRGGDVPDGPKLAKEVEEFLDCDVVAVPVSMASSISAAVCDTCAELFRRTLDS